MSPSNLRVETSPPSKSELTWSLPPEMVAEASWRLGWVGLLFASAALIALVARRVLIGWADGAWLTPRIQDLFALVNIAQGVAMYLAASRRSCRLAASSISASCSSWPAPSASR